MKTSLIALSLLVALPLAARAGEHECKYSAPRHLALDLAGVKRIELDTGAFDLKISGSGANAGNVDGRACASDQAALSKMTVSQEKHGDTLVVRLKGNGDTFTHLLAWHGYQYMELQATLPANLPLQLTAGSGDIDITGIDTLDAHLGSGDLGARNIRNSVNLRLASGDATLADIGALRVDELGSGDLKAKHVNGTVDISHVGSGDVGIEGAKGSVRVGSLGSGDLDLDDIDGNIQVGSIGSGDIRVADAKNGLSVQSVGSGDVKLRNVSGTVNLPRGIHAD